MTLIGFGVGFPLQRTLADGTKQAVTLTTLPDLRIQDFDIKLSGLDVYFNSPPVLISGYFGKETTAAFEAYKGGLAVSVLPYSMLAVGAYQHTLKPTDFKSVFVFARLDGPLFTLEFAEISGVKAGFGYNDDMRVPAPGDVLDYPLVYKGTGDGAVANPMDLLSGTSKQSFANWTTPKENSLWFAVGMKVDAFQILTVDAAAIITLGADSCKIAIVAMASASLPPSQGGKKPDAAFLYVEMGIVASLDITGGNFLIGAQLTPNSYILAPGRAFRIHLFAKMY